MMKLDRLGWAAGITFNSHGVSLGIRTNSTDPDLLEQIVACLPPAWAPVSSPEVDFLYSLRIGGPDPRTGLRRFHLLYDGPTQVIRTLHRNELFGALEESLTFAVASLSPRHVFVHAGAVGWRGRAILIPGTSHSGKTSLVAALVRAGATYYSDEFAVLDERGRVHPYHLPLSIRQGPPKGVEMCSAESLGGAAGFKPLPVGLVALTAYQSGARWNPRALSPGQSTLMLLANTVPVRRRPADVLATLQQVVTTATTLQGPRGEAEQTAMALLGGNAA